MRALVHFLIKPFTFFWILMLTGLVFQYLHRKKTANKFYRSGIIVLIIFSLGPVPQWLVYSLESKYPPYHYITPEVLRSSKVDIMILGGGHTSDTALPANNQLSQTALGRITEGIRLYRQIPGSTLVVSGWAGESAETQASLLAQTAILLGADSNTIRKLQTPTNTLEEAKAYYQAFGNTHTLILVTDAIHMPRAMMHFHNQGIKPIPAPTNHILKNNPHWYSRSWLPSLSNLGHSEAVINEYVGLGWGWLSKNRD